MLTTLRSQLRLWKHSLYRLRTDPKLHLAGRVLFFALSGFVLSAASLANYPQPFALALVCALSGGQAALAALGGAVGYGVFWGAAGTQGILWVGLGLGCAAIMGLVNTRHSLMLPALAGLICALSGLLVQRLGDTTPPAMYLLRIGLAMGGTRLLACLQERRDSIAGWLVRAVAVLALAQLVPVRWLCLGYVAAAAVAVKGAFPAAAMAGLALDVAQVTPVSMTAVLSAAWLCRLLPLRRLRAVAPAVVYPVIMALIGHWDLMPVPALLIGGLIGLALPGEGGYTPRRGEVGVAQVRLELAASVLEQVRSLLLLQPPAVIDEGALLEKACQRACDSCSFRKNCAGRIHARNLSTEYLKMPLTDSSLPFSCRRSGRLLQELRRSQEQLRLLGAGAQRQREYRSALLQQYGFLTQYLQELSDQLSSRGQGAAVRYRAQVSFSGNHAMADNGDRCLAFAGTGCRYYVALCDGMGTGVGAADESRTAGGLLQKLLSAGFPAQHALQTLNSLCALQDRAGSFTVDLCEIHLDTGRALLYKWGAAPSWLLSDRGSEKIGTAGPPPGLSVDSQPEAVCRLSLRGGEVLVMLSDGAGGEEAPHCHVGGSEALEDLAIRILDGRSTESGDDATVALIRLCSDLRT